MIALVSLLVASLALVHAAPAPGSLLYPVVPAAPHAYVVKPYAAAAPVVPLVHTPTSYSHVSHTQYTSHPVPAAPVYHTPLVYHEPAVPAVPAAYVV